MWPLDGFLVIHQRSGMARRGPGQGICFLSGSSAHVEPEGSGRYLRLTLDGPHLYWAIVTTTPKSSATISTPETLHYSQAGLVWPRAGGSHHEEHLLKAASRIPTGAADLIAAAWHLLCENVLNDNPPLASGADATWQSVCAYLSQNLERGVGRADTAQALGLHPHYLSDLCRSQTGRRFGEILTDLRIDCAEILLRDTNLPISSIAKQ